MFLSELGYSELVQRLFEKMTFFLVDPLLPLQLLLLLHLLPLLPLETAAADGDGDGDGDSDGNRYGNGDSKGDGNDDGDGQVLQQCHRPCCCHERFWYSRF